MGPLCYVRMRCAFFSAEERIEILLFDITEEKRRIEELERINHHLDKFIYHTSHDLRSPLTTLLGLLQLSKKTTSPETIQHYIDLMIGRTKHLDSLLTDLASIAFNEKAPIQVDKVDFENEMNVILKQFGSLSSSIVFFINVVQMNEFGSDISRLKPILQNLISNSIKYYNPSEEQPFVKISILSEEDYAKIEVSDNGIGIDPKHNEQIYTMFFRGTSSHSGSGLGLYIVKSMVEKLNGKISHSSIPAKGSTFIVTIPNLKKSVDRKNRSYAII
jgi:signal transduction histidine kinase